MISLEIFFGYTGDLKEVFCGGDIDKIYIEDDEERCAGESVLQDIVNTQKSFHPTAILHTHIHPMIPAIKELDGQVQLEIPGTIDLCTLKQIFPKLTITWSKDNVCACHKEAMMFGSFTKHTLVHPQYHIDEW